MMVTHRIQEIDVNFMLCAIRVLFQLLMGREPSQTCVPDAA